MSLLAFGVNHTTAPVELREKLSFSTDLLPAALSELTHEDGIHEAAILST